MFVAVLSYFVKWNECYLFFWSVYAIIMQLCGNYKSIFIKIGSIISNNTQIFSYSRSKKKSRDATTVATAAIAAAVTAATDPPVPLPPVPLPPRPPSKEKIPLITIPSSSLASDWAGIINQQDHSDVMFELGAKTFYAHQYVLCATSKFFRAIFGLELDLHPSDQCRIMSQMQREENLVKVSIASAKEVCIKGILSVQTK